MGIVRTVEWRLTCTPEESDGRLRQAFEKLGLTPDGAPGSVSGQAKRSLMKNRWAASLQADVSPAAWGSTVVCRVDMAGTKHFAVLDDLAEAVGDDVFDDRGVAAAVERLGKAARLFGRKEIRHLRNLLRSSEEVAELGQGEYEGKQGLVVLTNERLFFFEKSLGSETVEEFPLKSISSLSVSKGMTGETLKIFASGNEAQIKRMGHADALTRGFRQVSQSASVASEPASGSAAQDDPIAQIERLATLREKGVLSEQEFEDKKRQLLDRF
jgi:Bacterial PH domain/Short C-terminal domain